ncbi:MAG: ribonuclease H-like domain-containing protein [Bacillota bacterium]
MTTYSDNGIAIPKPGEAEIQEIGNEVGTFGLIETITQRLEITFPSNRLLQEDFSLLYGVGAVTAQKLREEGYRTVGDLLNHPKWRRAARDLLKAIESKDIPRLARYGASDLQLLSFYQPDSVLFLDIETVGLYYIHPVFLVGFLEFKKGQGVIRQFLARDFDEEKAVLYETAKLLQNVEVVVSFNGRSFDLPYLRGRMRFHNLDEVLTSFHFDLLRQARRDYKKALPNCRLLTIEKCLLNQERRDDIPGPEVAEYYYSYLDTGNYDCIYPVLKHNAADLFSMAEFLGLLTSKRTGR